MSNDDIDYTRYTLEQLLSCQRNIDATRFPGRAAQIDLLIRDRMRQQQILTPCDEHDCVLSGDEECAPFLFRDFFKILLGLVFGFVWIGAHRHIKDAPPQLVVVGYLSIAYSLISGLHRLIRNSGVDGRFKRPPSMTTSLSRAANELETLEQRQTNERERDKGKTKQGVRWFEGNHCPFCGAKVEQTHDFCPSCGLDI